MVIINMFGCYNIIYGYNIWLSYKFTFYITQSMVIINMIIICYLRVLFINTNTNYVYIYTKTYIYIYTNIYMKITSNI